MGLTIGILLWKETLNGASMYSVVLTCEDCGEHILKTRELTYSGSYPNLVPLPLPPPLTTTTTTTYSVRTGFNAADENNPDIMRATSMKPLAGWD